MPREDARTKGLRYLTEGRLTVTRVNGDDVEAVCRGGGEFFRCGHDRKSSRWYCDCPAKTRCSHLWALQTVTIRRTA